MSSASNIEGLLFDLDGVLYVGDQVIEGALESIQWVQDCGISHRYITNTTTHSTETLSQKLKAMGFAVEAHEIISAPYATVLYLRHQGNPSCYLLLADDAMRDFREFKHTDKQPDYVVIGDIGEAWNYALLNRVFQMLIGGSRLIALHKGKFWQTEAGLQLDIGAFVAALEYAAGVEALVIGKPAPAFFQLALEGLGLTIEVLKTFIGFGRLVVALELEQELRSVC